MEWLNIVLLVFFVSVSCNKKTPTLRRLNAKVNMLQMQTTMLQQNVHDIWNELSDAVVNDHNNDTSQTTLDDSSRNEIFRLLNASIADMKGLKLESEQLVMYARKGIQREKAYNRDAMARLANSMVNITNSQDLQRQLIDELTVKIEERKKEQQQIIHNLSQYYRDLLEENKGEIQVCNDKLTSVEQVLDGVIQELKGVEQVAKGNKKILSCDDGWKSFLDHCYFFSSEATTWDKALEFCQNNESSLLEIDMDEEVQFILDTPTAGQRLWLGAHDRAEEGQFTWLSSKRPVLPHLWYKNEPNNGRNNEDCVEIYKYYKGRLNDCDCSRNFTFACEKNIRFKLW